MGKRVKGICSLGSKFSLDAKDSITALTYKIHRIHKLGVIFLGGRVPRLLYTAENNEGSSFESLNLNYIQSSVFIVLFPLTYGIAGL